MCCYFSYPNPCRCSCCSRPCRPFPPSVPIPTPRPPASLPSVASFTQTAQAQVAANAPLPLVTDFNSDPNNYSLSNNAVTLSRGYYIVSFSANVLAANAQVDLALTLNGSVVNKSQTTAYSGETGGANLASTFILYVPTSGSQISLINAGADTAQFTNANLVLQKINVG